MQFFFRNCTHILTRTQGEKFEDTFLVKTASKGISLISNTSIFRTNNGSNNQIFISIIRIIRPRLVFVGSSLVSGVSVLPNQQSGGRGGKHFLYPVVQVRNLIGWWKIAARWMVSHNSQTTKPSWNIQCNLSMREAYDMLKTVWLYPFPNHNHKYRRVTWGCYYQGFFQMTSFSAFLLHSNGGIQINWQTSHSNDLDG